VSDSKPDLGKTRAKDSDFRKLHPRLADIVYVSDDPTLGGRVRRHLRNPSIITILLIVLVVLAIPSAIAYPRVSSVAKENWSDVQHLRERHFVNITAASWIYPHLRLQATRMQNAEIPVQWRPVSFKSGPCLPDNLSQIPVGKYAYAIKSACISLDDIQMTYAGDCAQTSQCNIPEQAVIELQQVLDRLQVAFSDANLVDPYPDDDLGQKRD
jgi:hypothetical protein